MWVRTLLAVSERAGHLPLILNFQRFTKKTNVTKENFQRPLEKQKIIFTPEYVASFGVPAGAMPGIVPGLSSEEEAKIKDTGKAIGAVAGVPAGAMPGIVPGLSSEDEAKIKDTGKAIYELLLEVLL